MPRKRAKSQRGEKGFAKGHERSFLKKKLLIADSKREDDDEVSFERLRKKSESKLVVILIQIEEWKFLLSEMRSFLMPTKKFFFLDVTAAHEGEILRIAPL